MTDSIQKFVMKVFLMIDKNYVFVEFFQNNILKNKRSKKC
jgi:hypothetical protein